MPDHAHVGYLYAAIQTSTNNPSLQEHPRKIL